MPKGCATMKHSVRFLVRLVLPGILLFSLTSCGPTTEKKFTQAIQAADFSTAQLIIDENANNAEFAKYVDEQCNLLAVDAVQEYCLGNADYDTTKSFLKGISSFSNISESKQLAEDIKTSKSSYTKGKNKMEKDAYDEAYHLFSKVLKEDLENFESATSLLNECVEKYNEQLDNKLTAISNSNSPIDELLDFEYDSKIVSEASKTKYKNIKEPLVSKCLDTATALAENGNYKDAANQLAPYTSLDVRIKNSYNEYSQEADKQTIQKLKQKITVSYDDISREYKIVPRGHSTEYTNIGWSKHISPEIHATTSDSDFYLFLGFFATDWIFTEKITIDCDGRQFTYDVDYVDLITKVGSGAIAEVYPLMHSTSLSYDNRVNNLTALIDAASSAEAVRVRFYGSYGNGAKDFTISSNQLAEIKTLWELNTILSKNPKLVSKL